MRQSYYTKPSGSMGFANTGFSQRGSRQTQVYIAILLGRAVGGAISNRLLGANSLRVRLQRTALSYIPQILHAVRIRRSPFGVLSGVAQNRFIKYVYFSTSKFGVVAASQIGISRLVWFTLLRLIRTQKLNLLQKKTLSSEYDLHLRNFFNKLRKLEGFRNWVVSESSDIHFILNKTYRWLHHAFRFFQKHKRNVQSVLNYRTVRMGRCFLTPFLMRKFSRIQTVRKMMTFSFREWKRYYRNMKNILSRASIRSVLWNNVGRRGLSKLGTYVRNSQMLKLTVPKSTVEALNFSMEAYNPLIKPNSGRPLSNTGSQNANSIRLKNFLSTDSSKVYTNMRIRKSTSLEPDMSSSFSQKSKINPPYLFRATGPSRACKQPPLLKVRTESWCGLKPFDRGGNLKRFGGFRSTLSEFVKRNQLTKAAKLPLGKLLDGQRYVTNRNFGADVAVGYRLSLLSYRKTITNRRLSTLLSLAGGIATPSNLEIRLMVMEMLSFILSSDKRVLLANQIALRILPKTSQLSYTSHTDIVGAKIANKNKVKVFRQRFFKRRLLRFFKKWKFVSRILQVRTLLFKPHWVMRKINRKSKTPLSFSSYT